MKQLSTLLILLFAAALLRAVPARPALFTVRLADGTETQAIMTGDEYWHCLCDEQGMLLEPADGGLYIRTDRPLSSVNIEAERSAAIAKLRREQAPGREARRPARQVNTVQRSPVILVSFSDKRFSNTAASFDNMLNRESGERNNPSGSVREYFATSSYGQFVPEFDVYGPYTLDHDCAYYGGNSGGRGNDRRAAQMVVDAVAKLAADRGQNALSQYDADGDGYVDNVFIFYAGHGENAGGGEDCIWPHRSFVYSSWVDGQLTYGGVTIGNYACSCELQGASGSTRSGIGPFCHEFSHVIGLPDLYDTGYSGHRTPSTWDVMDQGNYLNSEHTPPSYSAYERFYMGWLRPEVLCMPDNCSLYDLTSTNRAYLVSATAAHNLDGEDPQPGEFYMLENRQNVGWDKYLPGHGLLVTHVRFDRDKWDYNTVNNDRRDMGVDIVEAGGVQGSMAGPTDPFPGADSVTSYSPYSSQPLTEITDLFGRVDFKYRGGRDYYRVRFDAMGRGSVSQEELIEATTGAGVALPNVTDVAAGYSFAGWSESASASRADAGAALERYYPVMDRTLFAVYTRADTVVPTATGCVTETFDRATANGGYEITDKLDRYTDMPGWSGVMVKQAKGALRSGDNTSHGLLITPRLHVAGDVTLSFLAAGLIDTRLVVTAENGEADTVQIGTAYTLHSVSLGSVPVDSRVSFRAEANIFFLDSVEICGALKSPVETLEAAAGPVLLRDEEGVAVVGLEGDEMIYVYDLPGRVLMSCRASGPRFEFRTGEMVLLRVVGRRGAVTLK